MFGGCAGWTNLKILTNVSLLAGAMDINGKELHDDGKEPFDIHDHSQQQSLQQQPHQQPTAISHPILHPGLSRPQPPPQHHHQHHHHQQQTTIQRSQQPPPTTINHTGKETRPSVIESSQPHIIECT